MTESGSRRRRVQGSLKGARFLASRNIKLASLIEEVGPPALFYETERSVFEALVSAIVHQQLHGRAAETIFGRFCALFPAGFPSPEQVLRKKPDQLLRCGLSRAKASAIRDLAAKSREGIVPLRAVAEGRSDEELVEAITEVKGIGRWTVEMFLIFTLGRPDVWPVHDYGVRKGYARVFGRRALPSPKQLEKLGEEFRPHRSVLAWYLWRATELKG